MSMTDCCRKCGHPEHEHIEDDDCYYCLGCHKFSDSERNRDNLVWSSRYHKFSPKGREDD